MNFRNKNIIREVIHVLERGDFLTSAVKRNSKILSPYKNTYIFFPVVLHHHDTSHSVGLGRMEAAETSS